MRIFGETLKLIRGDALVREACTREGHHWFVTGADYNLSRFRRVLILGAGKASAAMAQAVDEQLHDVPVEGVVVTKSGYAIEAGRIEVLEAAHPIPDATSLHAGARILEAAQAAAPDDLVVVLISGGASALMESLVDGVSLADIQAVTRDLLRAGADIFEVNAVRKCLSKIKAGGLARACGSATILCLLLSDVLGNSREVIGSAPCWGAPPSGDAALAILKVGGVPIPEAVASALTRVPSAPEAHPEHVVIGDIYTALEAAQKSAIAQGFRAKVYGRTFSGEARVVGARMAAEAIYLRSESDQYDAVIAGGETTVTVRGDGKGGRNQELACAAAIALADVPDIALLAVGTDGTDGPTDAAGGLVDGETHLRTDLRAALSRNDSLTALQAADALVVTGPTQTNLNDLVIITRAPGPEN